jgi:16S rRNA (guanine527-N7)-methyltransferase
LGYKSLSRLKGGIPKKFPWGEALSFINDLIEIFEKNKIPVSERDADFFSKYYELLSETNSKINLTSVTDPKDVIVKHFLDSVIPSPIIPINSLLADIGSGAGLPGIPLKIVRDDISLTMIESTGKKARFLENTVTNLGLERTYIFSQRAEVLARGTLRNRFDVVTARAVAPLNILLEYAMPLLWKGGLFIAYKGPGAHEEIEAAKRAADILGGELQEKWEFNLNGEYKRIILIFKKTEDTPDEFPRENKNLLRKPLGEI